MSLLSGGLLATSYGFSVFILLCLGVDFFVFIWLYSYSWFFESLDGYSQNFLVILSSNIVSDSLSPSGPHIRPHWSFSFYFPSFLSFHIFHLFVSLCFILNSLFSSTNSLFFLRPHFPFCFWDELYLVLLVNVYYYHSKITLNYTFLTILLDSTDCVNLAFAKCKPCEGYHVVAKFQERIFPFYPVTKVHTVLVLIVPRGEGQRISLFLEESLWGQECMEGYYHHHYY